MYTARESVQFPGSTSGPLPTEGVTASSLAAVQRNNITAGARLIRNLRAGDRPV